MVLLYLCLATAGYAQRHRRYADSIRLACGIPELAYAVVSADQVMEMNVAGVRRAGSHMAAETDDLFRLGSNTKAITGMIAAVAVKAGKISWSTRFFDLYPQLKAQSNKAYHNLTLQQLLTFRTRLCRYTYTDVHPTREELGSDHSETAERYALAAWCLRQQPVGGNDSINFSNPAYVLAGMMLEKACNKAYQQLLIDLGSQLGITFHTGQPNVLDSLQPWGHNARLQPEAPFDNYKLSWLLPAGNVTMSLPEYAKLMQVQLQGLAGKSSLLSAAEFRFLLGGFSRFSVGWFSEGGDDRNMYSHNTGNPGSFLSYACVFGGKDKSIILLGNVQSDAAERGMEALLARIRSSYKL